jgi:hypothetical protein
MRTNTVCWLRVTGLAVVGSFASADQRAPHDPIPMDADEVDCSGLKDYEPTVYYKKGDEVKAEESGYRELGRYRCKEGMGACHDHEPRKSSDVWEHRGHCKKK